jgi:hypothetical protein
MVIIRHCKFGSKSRELAADSFKCHCVATPQLSNLGRGLVFGWVTAWEQHVLLVYKAEGCTENQERSRCKGRSGGDRHK